MRLESSSLFGLRVMVKLVPIFLHICFKSTATTQKPPNHRRITACKSAARSNLDVDVLLAETVQDAVQKTVDCAIAASTWCNLAERERAVVDA
mmetsp:Transcript_48857/g.105846  ORF Transcript_48857/g.105846 Transcript_48857/m.105846 type:complete len:93 (-) Transcript_48857:1818-2096(-)